MKHSEGHKWFYKYRQEPDEVVLIKCFDSDQSVKARRTPHCAVKDGQEDGGEAEGNRESVEVRLLVFY